MQEKNIESKKYLEDNIINNMERTTFKIEIQLENDNFLFVSLS